MLLNPVWVLQGYFDFSDKSPTPSQLIRDDLARGIGRPLEIYPYPSRMAWKHTFWWREGTRDYAEAQFCMSIALLPVLSLGLSVEKGVEIEVQEQNRILDRRSWDWTHLQVRAYEILADDLPKVAASLKRPLNVRCGLRPRGTRPPELRDRTYSFVEGRWFQRHLGSCEETDIVSFLSELDQQKDCSVTVSITIDLSPGQVAGLDTSTAASSLVAFNDVRLKLRGTA